MKASVMGFVMLGAVLLAAADAMAWGDAGGSGRSSHGPEGGSVGGGSHGNTTASVPEPSALYAVGSGLAVLGGAAWYIRRRK